MVGKVTLKLFCILFFVITSVAQEKETEEDTEQEQTVEEKGTENPEQSENTTESDSLFWTPPALNDSVSLETAEDAGEEQNEESNNDIKANSTIQDKNDPEGDIHNVEIGSENVETANETGGIQHSSDSDTDIHFVAPQHSGMDERIVLPRNNCNLELIVEDNHDTRIEIKFEPMTRREVGKCCIALNGGENALLAVQIRNVHLQNGKGQQETLRVVLTTSGVDFILREYYEGQQYQPLLLTESHAVYIILHYNNTLNEKPSNDYSYFDLEAFRYGTNQHNVFHQVQGYQSPVNFGSFKASTQGYTDNIYFTTNKHPTYYQNRYVSIN